jgi:hypothetical protein
MRKLALFAIILPLAACQTLEEQREAIKRADDAQCIEYGAKRGTPAYTQCRLEIDRNRLLAHQQQPRPTVFIGVSQGPYWGPRYGGYCRHTPWGVRCY